MSVSRADVLLSEEERVSENWGRWSWIVMCLWNKGGAVLMGVPADVSGPSYYGSSDVVVSTTVRRGYKLYRAWKASLRCVLFFFFSRRRSLCATKTKSIATESTAT